MKKRWRAIDLYSGVGGWSLGLKAAGIDVVASYEWWKPAIVSSEKNNHHQIFEIDIRKLKLSTLPKSIDVVVGSPPCTQFSFSNRGGKGDIEDGLRDIEKFLEVVDYLKPKVWAMENVPRVAKLLETAFSTEGRFIKYAHLNPSIFVVDCAEYGLPQRRLRTIVGSFDTGLLASYKAKCSHRTLGDVVAALNSESDFVDDPNWNLSIAKCDVYDHKKEPSLSVEERRLNRDAKVNHPIYNNMSFPDSHSRPARTITATCTRVSRESIVISENNSNKNVRRLTVRERACLQGFPISYQFFGKSHAEKFKLIGNAVPPVMTYFIGCAFKKIPEKNLKTPSEIKPLEQQFHLVPPDTLPDGRGKLFNKKRSFSAAIPVLRYKSGTRFELANTFRGEGTAVNWSVKFFWGSSKRIYTCRCDPNESKTLLKFLSGTMLHSAHERIKKCIGAQLPAHVVRALQDVWSHRATGVSPHDVVDLLAEIAITECRLLEEGILDTTDKALIWNHISSALDLAAIKDAQSFRVSKLESNSVSIFVGLLIAVHANEAFATAIDSH